MVSLRFRALLPTAAGVLFLLLFPACGGHKPPGASPLPVEITLSPSTSFSMQVGSTIQLSATAQNSAQTSISPTFIYTSSNPGIVDVAPNGAACAGTWNSPLYSICTPAGTGTASVTASALGATSPPTLFFVHPPIDNIEISIAPPVNSPPPACVNQTALPAACNIAFNTGNCTTKTTSQGVPYLSCSCISQTQSETLQAKAFSQGTDITGSVGPITWSEVESSVGAITPIVSTSDNVATNQATIVAGVPGQTQVVASASGVSSQPYFFETCPVQCIALELGANGSQHSAATSFITTAGTSETITATAVDIQGCVVPKPPLTWVSSSPTTLSAGGTSGCAAGTTCSVSTKPGAAAITASCSPPTCNVGFPLNPAALSPPYVPEPVYPITAISGIVTPASSTSSGGTGSTATNVLASSQDCFSDPLCTVDVYSVSTSTNLPGGASQAPTPPNSILFDPQGDRAYVGSEFGASILNSANIGTGTGAFTTIAAAGTPLGLVTGRVIAVSANGSMAIFSDTVSTPNQVYVVTTSTSSTSAIALNINNAIAASFSPDGLKAFILANGGNTLYIYSPLQAPQPPVPLGTPAKAIAFNSTGSFALFSGGTPATSLAGSLAIYNTCDNSSVTLSPPVVTPPVPTLPAPPVFLRMVPPGNVHMGNAIIPNLDPLGLDIFFGLDNTGIDVIATTSSLIPLPIPPGPISLNTLCPRPVVLAQTAAMPSTTFAPVHIDIGQGTFQPIDFFISPDTTQAYIVASDRNRILVYNFSTNATSGIALANNATPVAADITSDGTLLYVGGSDGRLHELNTALGLDQNQISFPPLPNSTNSFCGTGSNCQLNIVAVKP